LSEHYQIVQIQSTAPDDGQKHCPKYVEPTWNNKLIYIVHLVGHFHRKSVKLSKQTLTMYENIARNV
jgi:hypothetical protein